MDITAWQDIIIALISAATGGGLLKIVDTWLTRAKLKNETAKQLRDEAKEEALALKDELKDFKSQIRDKEKEIDEWRLKYWSVFMEYKQFQLRVSQMLIENGISPNQLLKDNDGA